MRIKPVAFNYNQMAAEVTDLKVEIKRKNVVLSNERYTMWGELIDKDNGIMMLTSLALSRKYTKETKKTIFDEWKDFLNKFAAELPEEISRKWEEQAKRNTVQEAADKSADEESSQQQAEAV
ncbi:hypothetical protein D3C81_1018080 [compost metagenome]